MSDGQAFYNEIEPHAAEWLRNLITAGHIAPGVVDERSIDDLTPADVAGPGQRHFFAGIGVWSHALRCAGWPDDVGIWTGSCPCQGFSSAGQRRGFADERHLWPVWFDLIRECRPAVVVGEQVASQDALAWLDLVYADLEGAGYSVGALDIPAAGVGAPHIRQRLYFVAVVDSSGIRERLHVSQRQARREVLDADRRGAAGVVGDTSGTRGGRDTGADARAQGAGSGERARHRRDGDGAVATGAVGDMVDAASRGRTWIGTQSEHDEPLSADEGKSGRRREGREAHGGDGAGSPDDCGDGRTGRLADTDESYAIDGDKSRSGRLLQPASDATAGFWSDAEWIPCRDGKLRPVEPGTFPLAHGVTGRVGLLRGYGNGLCAPLATSFIEAVIDVLTD